jgi:hypothetical protein
MSSIYKPVVDFYVTSRKLSWLRAVELQNLGDEFDYIYYKPEDERAVLRLKTIELAVYPITDDVLVKKAPD